MSAEVISLGCRLNISESEKMRGLLAEADDLVVVNSCAVTNEALRQTRRAIRRARRARPDARLLVTGCAAETDRAMLAAMPEVDGLVANSEKLDPRRWNVAAVSIAGSSERYSRAFVQAQNGCDHACTFCVIPQGRGPARSLSAEAVCEQVAREADRGVNEVVLTGVDLTSWGGDLPGKPALGALVESVLARVPSLPRLRLSSIDGAEIDQRLFDLLAHEPRLMPHVHLSLQSGDDMILKRMKRRHLRADALRLVTRLRATRPDLAVGADLIAGFPTETEAMHRNSLALIAELRIVHGHIFPYSARAGTPAARMPQVDPATIKRRARELREAVATERAEWLASLLGQPQQVLVERGGTGHSPAFAPVRVTRNAPIGDIVSITPTRIEDGILA